MIQNLRRKMGLLGRDEGGQSLVFVAMSLLLMFLFVCVTVDVGDFVAQKIDAQNDADAMAISTAVWQARGLNVVQSLNIAKNLAHMHYMLEVMEVIYWATVYVASEFVDLNALWNLYRSVGDPVFCWLLDLCPDESLPDEKDDLETELNTLTRIQKYIGGVDPWDEQGSVENAIRVVTIPLVESLNNDGTPAPASLLVNWVASGGVIYDPALQIEFVQRDNFYRLLLPGVDSDVLDFLDWVFDVFEVDFDWAVQKRDAPDDQFTVGFAVRDIRPAPMFGSKFQAKTLISEIFGRRLPLIDGEFQLAIAQAKPFKAEAYTIDPGDGSNGLSANLLGIPFIDLIGLAPEGNTNAFWDVKLTPVTVLRRLAPPMAPLMTH